MRPDPFSLDDTIVALATPPGRSALALLRVSGKDSGPILRRVAPGLPENLTPRAPRLVAILGAEGAPVDRGLVTFFPGPGSATGEDVAELSVHGGPAVVRGVLAALVSAGARPARPGEFTRRAFLSGRLDLVEAEAVRE
ncbi:MAG: tRNA uridine-5-carboxymethylaminomethyl(34) synthesis GTPase MnmE, partial [Acidobacteriota bacterium]|nr:tRNA uridine-5-carboxymethylaminomethyl(34) synthesis GTPase MnmE [Acidobacteriota bacterium]